MNYEASLIQTVQTLKTSSRVAESWRLYRSQAHRRRTVSPCQVKMSFPGKQRVAGLASAPVSHPCVGTGGPHESGWLLGAARTMCIHIYIYLSNRCKKSSPNGLLLEATWYSHCLQNSILIDKRVLSINLELLGQLAASGPSSNPFQIPGTDGALRGADRARILSIDQSEKLVPRHPSSQDEKNSSNHQAPKQFQNIV